MAFIIVASVPQYDNRDAICGSFRSQSNPNSYETMALALRMLPAHDEEDDEVDYFVVDTTDAYRRPIRPEPRTDLCEDEIFF
jgi:hypothetical protein